MTFDLNDLKSLESVGLSETHRGIYWIITYHTNTLRWFIVFPVSDWTFKLFNIQYRSKCMNPCLHVNPSTAPHPLVCVISPHWGEMQPALPLGWNQAQQWVSPRCWSVDTLACFCISWHFHQRVCHPPPPSSKLSFSSSLIVTITAFDTRD